MMARPIDILQQDGRYNAEQVKALETAQPKLQMAMENIGSLRTEQVSESVQLAGIVKGLLSDAPENAEALADQHYKALKSNGAELAGAFAQGTAYWRENSATNEMADLISTGVAGSEGLQVEKMAEKIAQLEDRSAQKPADFRSRVSQPPTAAGGLGA